MNIHWLDKVLSLDFVPETVLRQGIRLLLAQRLRDEGAGTVETRQDQFREYLAALRRSPIAVQCREANEQHYEVPTRFYQLCLGHRLKYSSCLWDERTPTLDAAEDRMLDLVMQRADLREGQEILDLGCGWGSFSFYAAERLPQARFTAVSNSRTQRAYIELAARERGLKNIQVITGDINELELAGGFDRVVSVEMFEHMKNYQLLLAKVARWMKPDARLFVHIFTHSEHSYAFEPSGPTDWMSRYFFSGGQMPSNHLLYHFQDDLRIRDQWVVSGTHYQKTADAWLRNMEANQTEILSIFEEVYGRGQSQKWYAYWKIFYLSCSELWGYRGGSEWMVCHYLFSK